MSKEQTKESMRVEVTSALDSLTKASERMRKELDKMETAGEDLSAEIFEEMKNVATKFNVWLALYATRLLIGHLVKQFSTEFRPKQQDISKGMAASPFANGFDIEYKDSDKKISFVAEVKSNIPINKGDAFGGKQKENIKKDLHYLRNGKSTSYHRLKDAKSLEDYYKFFGIFCDEKGHVEKAMNSLYKTIKDNADIKPIEFLEEKSKLKDLDRNTIYIVLLK